MKQSKEANKSHIIIDYVKSLDLSELEKPLDRSMMMKEQLHIGNPLVADLIEYWLDIRARRMQFEKQATKLITKAQEEVAKFH